jgi:hypothetical protein
LNLLGNYALKYGYLQIYLHDDDDDVNADDIIVQFNSLLLCAESTATRPITDTAQFRYKYLHYGRTQLKIKV